MTDFELFNSLEEYYAAGLFEFEDEAPVVRYSNALKYFWEKTDMPCYNGGLLYPNGVCTFNYNKGMGVVPHYANTFEIRHKTMKAKSEEAYKLILDEESKVAKFSSSPHTVGGMGWTHSFPNYERVLRKGLNEYRRRIEELEDGDFKKGMLLTLEGIDIYHSRCLTHLKTVNAPNKLISAFEKMPYLPAENVYEAMVSLNFTYYVDGCDDIGPLDKLLLPYYNGEDLVEIIRQFFSNVDANDGWSGTLGPDYNDITRMCLRAIHNGRRPNLQLLVKPDMPDWVWEESIASLATSCGQPALYNYGLYMENMRSRLPYIPEKDLDRLAFGGCTETMIEGLSNVGSDDAGVNVALVFSDYMRSAIKECNTYSEFYSGLVKAIRKTVAETLDLVNEYRRTRALYRPDVVRTLLIDDCIEKQTEFHAGGARYNWSVVNIAGVINVIDSLSVIKKLVFDEKRYKAGEFIEKLDARDAELLHLAECCPNYGNDNDLADGIGNQLLDDITKAFDQRECYPSGKFYTVCNQFHTYVPAGKKIPATPDGRGNGAPLCDSMGAIHGNDTKGPTALLNSVCKLKVEKILGTPITNIRISKENLPNILKPLVLSYFENGGMQLQVSCLSREEMLDALEHPEDHKSLVVRVGGFSEYFNNLSAEVKQTIIERTEH